ncbi:hypothetical protein WR25_10939 [Diploscapter pachys]|uniref:Amidohydrolase-related domain-containing protein n=1 Tax=Diploscapter pachys TaxID=2018661 RepID=A0A2A2LY67_9BILA|nr:hypothetical protein WR25_10939 [Diploscapter pachys]
MVFLTLPPRFNLSVSNDSLLSPRKRDASGSNKSEDAKSLSSRPNSRPNSRQTKTSSPAVSSQPTSSRSAKSSPIPPQPAEVPPPLSRHRMKGLETSQAMLELFGGGPSYTHPLVDHVLTTKQEDINKNPPPHPETAGYYDPIYHRMTKHTKGMMNANTDPFSQPGPEIKDDSENVIVVEDGPDPNCPAERVLQEMRTNETEGEMKKGRRNRTGMMSPSSSGQHQMESLPGPDLGSEDEEEHQTEIVSETGVPSERDEEGEMLKGGTRLASSKGEEDRDAEEGEGVRQRGEETEKGHHKSANQNDPAGPGNGQANHKANSPTESFGSGFGGGGAAGSSAANGSSQDNGGGTATGEQDGKQGKKAQGDMPDLIIKGAQVVNDDSVFVADILIRDGIIQNVGPNLEVPDGSEVLDAGGKMLMPAGIDVHTQLTADDSADDLQTGCKAALAGGTATVIEVVSPKTGESLSAAFNRTKKELDKAICNIALSVIIRQWNESIKKEMDKLVQEGVNSFVIEVESDDKLYQILEHARSIGAHARILPENRTIVPYLERKMLEMGITGPEGFLQSHPEELEGERVSSIGVLSQLTNCPVSILSVSSSEAISSVEKSRNSGALIHAEVASAAVASDGSHYFNKCLRHASSHLTAVPLRTDATNKLVSSLSSQPLIVCSSGHRAISSSSRLASKDFASMSKGTTGVEERLAVLWENAVRTGRIDPMRFVAVTSSNAAKIFNLYPKKGRIAVGADADLVLWDASAKRQLTAGDSQSSVDISIYEGLSVHSNTIATIVGGKIAWKDGKINDKEAKGGFVSLQPHSPYLFSIVQQRDKMVTAEKVDRDSVAAQNGNRHRKISGEMAGRARKTHMESSIDFGGDKPQTRVRNPPGGRTTGFW